MRSFAEINRTVDEFVVALDRSSSYSLDRIKELMDSLGNPQDSFKAVHIAGTSGKTSTAYFIAEMLDLAGYKVGLTVSPYIEEVNERVQIGTKPLAEPEFCRQLEEFLKILKSVDIKPTYFEFYVAFAYWYFAKNKIDYAVVEVGLGGLLDGTNVMVRPDKICVITDIGVDHIEVLGKSLKDIARQKAGIINNHNDVFMYRQNQTIEQAVFERAAREHAAVHYVGAPDEKGFLKRNWHLARAVCEFIFARDGNKGLSSSQWQKTATVKIPGRWEIMSYKDKTLILDGAHNSQKVDSLVQNIKTQYPSAPIATLLAVGKNKMSQLPEMANCLGQISDFFVTTSFEKDAQAEKSSADPAKIAKYFATDKALVEPDLQKAVNLLLERKEKLILVTGSLYLVSAIKKLLK